MRIPAFKFGYTRISAVELMRRDIEEVKLCFKAGTHKATMVLSGSVLECALYEYLSTQANALQSYHKLFPKSKKTKLEELHLNELLEVAKDLNVLRDETFQLCNLLRDYRNLVHPLAELRAATRPNKQRSNRSVEALIQALQELDHRFTSSRRPVYVLDIVGVPPRWVNSSSKVREAITKFAIQKGCTVNHIFNLAQFDNLIRNPPLFAIVLNAHGELLPMHRNWNWRDYYSTIAKAVGDCGWIFVSVAGYPFWAYGQNVECGKDGLNHFLSIVGASCDCFNYSPAEPTPEGRKMLAWADMKRLLPVRSQRAARWMGVRPAVTFFKHENFCGASAIRIGRGWFLQMGFDPSFGGVFPQQTSQQKEYGDTLIGNLAIACALRL